MQVRDLGHMYLQELGQSQRRIEGNLGLLQESEGAMRDIEACVKDYTQGHG